MHVSPYRLYRKAIRTIGRMRGSPEAIALGTSIGVFVAFTPTIGFQMLIGLFLATILKASRPAAMLPAWISNPVTIPPIFAFTYWIGSFFWSQPGAVGARERLAEAVTQFGEHRLYELHLHFKVLLKLGYDMFVPMLIGGIITGVVCGALAYPVALWCVKEYRLVREKRRHERAKRRARRLEERRRAAVEEQEDAE